MKNPRLFCKLLSLGLFLMMLVSAVGIKAQNFSTLEFGTDTTLEIVTWNIEWFPKNGQTTITDVSLIIDAMDADLIAVQEIDDKTSFGQMIDALDGWDAYFIYGEYNSLAYIYKEETIEFTNTYEIFTQDWREFPRSPLVAEFSYRDVPYVIINNHLKCCGDEIMNLLDEWDEETRRYDACNKLENYIETTFPSSPVILTGDLNDILIDTPENNVFAAFLDKPDDYVFADMHIAEGSSSNWSYPGWPSHLDHILVSNELFYYLSDDDSEVLTIKLNEYYSGGMSEYDNRVSDHLPVGMKLVLPESISISDNSNTASSVRIFPNPANEKIYLHGLDEKVSEYVIYDASGIITLSGIYDLGATIDITDLSKGMYFLNLKSGNEKMVFKLIKQ